MDNLTIAENDPFANLELENQTGFAVQTIRYDAFEYIQSAINLLLCLAAIIFNFFLIYAMIKFRKLRARINMYIFHIALCTNIYECAQCMEIVSLNFKRIVFLSSSLCVFFESVHDLLLVIYLLIWMLLADSFMDISAPKLLQPYAVLIGKLIAIVPYAIGSIKYFVKVPMCFKGFDLSVVNYWDSIIYCFLFLCSLLLNCKQYYITPTKSKAYSQKICNIFIYSWLPLFIYHLCIIQSDNKYVLGLLCYTYFIPIYIAQGCPLVVVYALGRLNEDYKAAYMALLYRQESYVTLRGLHDDPDVVNMPVVAYSNENHT